MKTFKEFLLETEDKIYKHINIFNYLDTKEKWVIKISKMGKIYRIKWLEKHKIGEIWNLTDDAEGKEAKIYNSPSAFKNALIRLSDNNEVILVSREKQ